MENENVEQSLIQLLKGLESKGVVLDNMEEQLDIVLRVGYFRISQIAVQIHATEPARQTTLSDIIKIFHYEQSLRAELMEYISYLEVQLRSILSAYYDAWYGAHGYLERKNFSDKAMIHGTVVAKVKKQLSMKSLYEVVDDKQIDEMDIKQVPVWIAMELATFHMLTMFYQILPVEKQDEIAAIYDVSSKTFLSWIEFLLVVRNACAHQGLLFNRRFNRKPIDVEQREATVGTAFYILNKLLTYEQYYSIKNELKSIILTDEYAWINAYFDIG